MLLTDEKILKKLKIEYCRAIALERYFRILIIIFSWALAVTRLRLKHVIN